MMTGGQVARCLPGPRFRAGKKQITTLPKSSPLRALVPVIIAVVPQMAAPITSGYSINSVRRTPPGRAK